MTPEGSSEHALEASRTAFAPATVGNVICGFDVFGLALESPGDRVSVGRSDRPGLRIVSITGDGGRIPKDPARNSATVAIRALLATVAARSPSGTEPLGAPSSAPGLDVTIEKGLPLSGGMGGSAASAVAAVVAADALLDARASLEVLLECAVQGEAAASGGAHLDNVAPALFGGLVLVRPDSTPRATRLPVPEGLHVALLHPAVEVSTRAARKALGTSIPIAEGVSQWGNTAAFVHALHTGDWDLLRSSLVDRIAEPRRAHLIPGFEAVRRAAVDAGALACGISGAGPSMIALCRGEAAAQTSGAAMSGAFAKETGLGSSLHLSAVAAEGARLVS